MLAQQPAAAAPAAMPLRFRAMPMAAELMGSVSAMPMSTETTTPMISGDCSVPQLMMEPSQVMK